MLLANLLGDRGIPTIVLERSIEPERTSRAIGVSIPSLEILDRLGLVDLLRGDGVEVPGVSLRGAKRRLGRIDFSNSGSRYDFVLAIPQARTCEILEDRLDGFDTVEVRRGWAVVAILPGTNCARVLTTQDDGSEHELSCSYIIGCDGTRSVVRHEAGIGFSGASYSDTFLMGDFVDRTTWGSEAYVFSTSRGSVESFPTPGGLRRYVLSTPGYIAAGETSFLEEEIPKRCGIPIAAREKRWESAFTAEHYIADSYFAQRSILAGDSAHTMSPIVGQNMNTGFADAEYLSSILPELVHNDPSSGRLLASYDKVRRTAALSATRRAWLMMRLATSGGGLWSLLRSAGSILLLRLIPSSVVACLFSMTSIPYRNLDDPRVARLRAGAASGV